MGHEFHRWKLDLCKIRNHNNIINQEARLKHLWEIKGWGLPTKKEGFGSNFLHASWIHLHWPSSPKVLARWKKSFDNLTS